ncbi:MAG: NAD(P)-dependent oxidoreductase [Chlamydiae bacterium]|nr:NAD(P)-dependent oxidoreductase [Chlamydiota bacterium]
MAQKKGNILITGVSGRIGFKAAEMFSKRYHVVGLDIVPPREKISQNFTFILADLSSDEKMNQVFDRIKKDFGDHFVSIIHLAAYYNFEGGAWEKYVAITIKGTERLLKNAKKCKVEQFIFSSTMLIHAPCEIGEKINEDSPIVPKWEYPRSKVETEKLMHEEHGSIPIVILRIAGVYDDECHSIPISQQIQRIYENQLESHVYPGNLDHGAAFIHMEDLLESILLTVEKRGELPPETTLIIGEPDTLSYGEMQKEIGRLIFHKDWKTFSVPKWFAKIGAWAQSLLPFGKKSFIKPWMIDLADDHYSLDISKAQNILGWQPMHSVRTVLPKMIEELKKDPKAWYAKNGLTYSRK